jgi:hypothetical protein
MGISRAIARNNGQRRRRDALILLGDTEIRPTRRETGDRSGFFLGRRGRRRRDGGVAIRKSQYFRTF